MFRHTFSISFARCGSCHRDSGSVTFRSYECQDDRPSESHSIISADTIIGLVQRFAMKALESSGHEQIAHWIKEWPEILGDKAGLAIKELLEKRQRGQPITKEDTHKVAETLAQNPRAAATLLGLLTADLLEGAADAESRRKTILQTYSSVLEIVCAYMALHHFCGPQGLHPPGRLHIVLALRK